jgi:hypothetical protein
VIRTTGGFPRGEVDCGAVIRHTVQTRERHGIRHLQGAASSGTSSSSVFVKPQRRTKPRARHVMLGVPRF